MPILGVDLAASQRRATGLCLLHEDMRCKTWLVHLDEEILQAVTEHRPTLAAVDAPLSLPSMSGVSHFRACDLELRRRGFRILPVTLGPMRMLTERGIRMRGEMERHGVEVIEVFPGATQDILGLPRKGRDLRMLVKGLRRMGLRCLSNLATGDEADAATCALTGLLYLKGYADQVGEPSEGVIVIPKRGVIDNEAIAGRLPAVRS